MKTWAKTAVAVLTVLWLSGCGGIPVNTDYDSDYQIPPTASYAWIDSPKQNTTRDPLVDNDLLERRVHRSVDEQLNANGLRPVNDGQQPDLLVAYHVGQEDKVDINTTDNFYGYYGYYPCWHCWGPGVGYGRGGDVWVNYYTEDTLLIDIVDAKTKKLVWRGVADRRLPKFKTPAERDAYVRETVSAIFQYFPPGRTPRK